jgi:hypothetical protein
LKQLDLFFSRVSAEIQADRRAFSGFHLVLFGPGEIEFNLPIVSGLEPFKFEIDGDKAAKLAVLEEQSFGEGFSPRTHAHSRRSIVATPSRQSPRRRSHVDDEGTR